MKFIYKKILFGKPIKKNRREGMFMYPKQIHQYLLNFFRETECEVLVNDENYMTVQLTVDIDKKMMNRPFYWQYVENANIEPAPAQLTLITNHQKLERPVKGEIVHFGSPRLHQLFKVTQSLGAFVEMYEAPGANATQQMILTPWLGVNYKIAYCSDRTKEMFYSLGMNLMTGEIIDGFQESIAHLHLHPHEVGNVFVLPYTIKPERALERVDQAIENLIHQDDHTWAEDAKKRFEKDSRVLNYFYEGVADKPESYETEKTALQEQYETRIQIEIINGGLFYLI